VPQGLSAAGTRPTPHTATNSRCLAPPFKPWHVPPPDTPNAHGCTPSISAGTPFRCLQAPTGQPKHTPLACRTMAGWQFFDASLRLRDPLKPTKPTNASGSPRPTTHQAGPFSTRRCDSTTPQNPPNPPIAAPRNVAGLTQWRQSARPLVVYGPYTTSTQISIAVRT